MKNLILAALVALSVMNVQIATAETPDGFLKQVAELKNAFNLSLKDFRSGDDQRIAAACENLSDQYSAISGQIDSITFDSSEQEAIAQNSFKNLLGFMQEQGCQA